MRLRLLLSFLVGTVFFTVLPIYAPFILWQADQMPRFLLGLGAGGGCRCSSGSERRTGAARVFARVSLRVPRRLFIRVGVSHTHVRAVGLWGPKVLAVARSYAVLIPFAFSYLVPPAAWGW